MKKIFFLYILLVLSCESDKAFKSNDILFDSVFSSFSKERKKQYLDSVFIEVEDSKNDSIKTKNLFNIASEYYTLKDNKSSFKVSSSIYMNAIQNKDSFSIGRAL